MHIQACFLITYIFFFFLVPDHVSKLFRKLIESLLITHAECKLNETGHLLSASRQSSNVNPNRLLENIWCVNLTHRPTST